MVHALASKASLSREQLSHPGIRRLAMSKNNPRASDDDRHMNDSTLPPPAKATISFNGLEFDSKEEGALVNTSISANDTTQNRIPPSRRPPSSGRAKVAQKKGFALHDWMHLVQNTKDLAQRKGSPIRNDIRKSELACHNKVEDGWLSLRGRVYNVTPYLHYHPGGVHILQPVLGKDATLLFDKYHRWVNIEGLIGSLLVGYLDATSSSRKEEFEAGSDTLVATSHGVSFPVPATQPYSPPSSSNTVDIPSLLKTYKISNSDIEDDKNPWEK